MDFFFVLLHLLSTNSINVLFFLMTFLNNSELGLFLLLYTNGIQILRRMSYIFEGRSWSGSYTYQDQIFVFPPPSRVIHSPAFDGHGFFIFRSKKKKCHYKIKYYGKFLRNFRNNSGMSFTNMVVPTNTYKSVNPVNAVPLSGALRQNKSSDLHTKLPDAT